MILDKVSPYVEAFKRYWDEFDLRLWAEEIGGKSAEAIMAAVYFGLFFSIGFLAKKYFKFAFWLCVATFLAIKVMEYNMLVSIDWDAVRLFIGIDQATDMQVMLNNLFTWIKDNVLLFIACAVGFLLGYKLG